MIGRHVIELRRRLVVPTAPRNSTIDSYNRTLITRDNHPLRIVRVNPELVIVVAPRSTFDCGPLASAIGGSIDRSVLDINGVCDLRIDGNFVEVPTASPNPLIA